MIVPPPGYLSRVRQLCDRHGVLLIADEIQSGLARTGPVLALDYDHVRADLYTLGKALGGGILPVSAVVGRADVLGVLHPGEHGSTLGGNPLACAVGRAVLRLLVTGEYRKRSTELDSHLHRRLDGLVGHGVVEVRGRGLWAGIDIDPELATGRQLCEQLATRGILAKDTHGSTIRLAPPLVIGVTDLDWALDQLATTLEKLQP